MEKIVTEKIKKLEDNINKLLNNFENETGIVFEEITFIPKETIFNSKDRDYIINNLKIYIKR